MAGRRRTDHAEGEEGEGKELNKRLMGLIVTMKNSWLHKAMLYPAAFIAAFVLAGCSTSKNYDARLNGTWRSNRDESVAAAFKQDPRWTNAPPEKVQRFKDIFGHITVTYANNMVRSLYRGQESFFRYRLIERGKDYVVIRAQGAGYPGDHNVRIRFVDGGSGIWVDSGELLGMKTPEEKFDRVSEPIDAVNANQPGPSDTNSTPLTGASRP
jgi:hypothetical protein